MFLNKNKKSLLTFYKKNPSKGFGNIVTKKSIKVCQRAAQEVLELQENSLNQNITQNYQFVEADAKEPLKAFTTKVDLILKNTEINKIIKNPDNQPPIEFFTHPEKFNDEQKKFYEKVEYELKKVLKGTLNFPKNDKQAEAIVHEYFKCGDYGKCLQSLLENPLNFKHKRHLALVKTTDMGSLNDLDLKTDPLVKLFIKGDFVETQIYTSSPQVGNIKTLPFALNTHTHVAAYSRRPLKSLNEYEEISRLIVHTINNKLSPELNIILKNIASHSPTQNISEMIEKQLLPHLLTLEASHKIRTLLIGHLQQGANILIDMSECIVFLMEEALSKNKLNEKTALELVNLDSENKQIILCLAKLETDLQNSPNLNFWERTKDEQKQLIAELLSNQLAQKLEIEINPKNSFIQNTSNKIRNLYNCFYKDKKTWAYFTLKETTESLNDLTKHLASMNHFKFEEEYKKLLLESTEITGNVYCRELENTTQYKKMRQLNTLEKIKSEGWDELIKTHSNL